MNQLILRPGVVLFLKESALILAVSRVRGRKPSPCCLKGVGVSAAHLGQVPGAAPSPALPAVPSARLPPQRCSALPAMQQA